MNMDADENSDGVIVPEKRSNNEGVSSAETVEGRTAHRSGRAGLPLPVLHGRVSLTDVVVDTMQVAEG